jgi:phage tail sheath protein FI
MASTTYLAPGVYVEEVPSAQQPIAGVGTNTVAFLGIVPDVIYYPEPNPDYDPVLAQTAIRLETLRGQLEGATDEDRTRIERELATARQRLESGIAILRREIADLDDQISQLAAEEESIPGDMDAESPSGSVDRRRAALSADRVTKQDELADLEQRLQELQSGPPTPAAPASALDEAALLRASALRPYVLRKFDVEVEPYETKLCTNFTEYTNRFGPFPADFPEPVPTTPEVQALLTSTHRALTHAVYGFFKNGGTRCFVARVRNVAEIDRALTAFESIDAVAIIAAPGLSTPGVWNQLVAHCDNSKDRFAILDCQEVIGTESELDLQLLSYDRAGNLLPQRSKNAAFYFPYIEVVDPAKQIQDQDPARRVPAKYWGRMYVPPSGHIAGIYARTDEERGVHKAPANCPILGALNVKYYISKSKQELLNPHGVNCIRNMNGNITVWGARTIGGDKNSEWKYINVRRFFLFLSESIDEGTQWVVFEPNDPALWGKIRRNVSAFLTNVWRAGALFGLTPEEAFYVKCDAENNPPEVRDLGMVVTEIGVAIVRPAEFVIFRVTQATGPRTV